MFNIPYTKKWYMSKLKDKINSEAIGIYSYRVVTNSHEWCGINFEINNSLRIYMTNLAIGFLEWFILNDIYLSYNNALTIKDLRKLLYDIPNITMSLRDSLLEIKEVYASSDYHRLIFIFYHEILNIAYDEIEGRNNI